MIKTLALALLLGAAATAVAADVYRWTDKEGKVHYSDSPPPGNKTAKPIVLPPLNTGTGDIYIEPKAPAPAQPVPQAAPPAQAPAAAAPRSNRGMPFDVYIMLRAGMSEGEPLQRAGPPDYESTDGSVGNAVRRRGTRVETFSNLELRKFYYYPTSSDPFTTVVTLTGGWISDLQRMRQF